jgi:anti-sigma regulatory factor (Ser/Thr protein kinase)
VSVDLQLPSHPDSIARARQALAELDDRVSPGLLEDLRLLVSEVVTNAVRHGHVADGEAVRVRIAEAPAHVRVEVLDPGPAFTPPVIDPEPGRAGGWGLWLVEALADRWGINGDGGTCVWFEVRYR